MTKKKSKTALLELARKLSKEPDKKKPRDSHLQALGHELLEIQEEDAREEEDQREEENAGEDQLPGDDPFKTEPVRLDALLVEDMQRQNASAPVHDRTGVIEQEDTLEESEPFSTRPFKLDHDTSLRKTLLKTARRQGHTTIETSTIWLESWGAHQDDPDAIPSSLAIEGLGESMCEVSWLESHGLEPHIARSLWVKHYARYAMEARTPAQQDFLHDTMARRLVESSHTFDLLLEPHVSTHDRLVPELVRWLGYEALTSLTLMVPSTFHPGHMYGTVSRLSEALRAHGFVMCRHVQGYSQNQSLGLTLIRFERGEFDKEYACAAMLEAEHGPLLWMKMLAYHTRLRRDHTTLCLYAGVLGEMPLGLFSPTLQGYTDLIHLHPLS